MVILTQKHLQKKNSQYLLIYNLITTKDNLMIWSVGGKMVIHMNDGKDNYECRGVTFPKTSKLSFELRSVTCKNCLKIQRFVLR